MALGEGLLGGEGGIMEFAVGDRLDPGEGVAGEQLVCGAARAGELGGVDPGGALGEQVEAGARDDPKEPGAQGGVAAEALAGPPCAHEGVLDGVLRVGGGGGHAVGVGAEGGAVAIEVARGEDRCGGVLDFAHGGGG
jgi:hypothetical protein